MFDAAIDEGIVWVKVSDGSSSGGFNMEAKIVFLVLIYLRLSISSMRCSTYDILKAKNLANLIIFQFN